MRHRWIGTWVCACIALLALRWGIDAHQSETPHHDTGPAAPASLKAPITITMEELHQHGGVPPGWQFNFPAGDPVTGRAVFEKLECFQCHAIRGQVFADSSPSASKPGPELTGMGAHHPAAYLAESVLNPNAVIVTGPGYTDTDGSSIMPDFRDSLSVSELIDLVAFLKSLEGEDSHTGAGPRHDNPTPGPLLEQTVGDYRIRIEYHAPSADRPAHQEHGHAGHGKGSAPAKAAHHLMAFIDDVKTGQPVPYLPVTATITAPKSPPTAVKLLPMIGARGVYYGADLALPPHPAKLTLSIGAIRIRAMPSAAGRFSSPHEVSLDWTPQPADKAGGESRPPQHQGHGKPAGAEGH
jgi:uncharacterized protein involved in high-affinity Fe2+ transport